MTEVVRPAGARFEGLALIAATLVVIAALTLYVRANGKESGPPKLFDWQVSAFDGLQGADQAIYNSLYTVKDEIPLIYDDINAFNEPGVKFRWPISRTSRTCCCRRSTRTRAGSKTARSRGRLLLRSPKARCRARRCTSAPTASCRCR